MCRSSEVQKFPLSAHHQIAPVPRSKKSKVASTLEVCVSRCSGKIHEKHAASVMRVARPDMAGDPQCPGRPVNVIELEDEVQEFEPSQDTGTRQILSVQVDVSDVRLLRPSTRLVLAMNSMDVGRREGARGVIDTAARCTVAGRAWDRAYRQFCAERSIGHLINVTPESEVYRFGNGGLLTSTERVTVPVVLADHPLLLSYSVVESPVLSLLIGRDVVEGLGLDIKCSSKTLEYNGRSQPLEDSVAGHYCVTLSPERYAGLLKLENSPDPPSSRLRPRPTSLVSKNSRSKLASTLEMCLSLQQQHLWTAQV